MESEYQKILKTEFQARHRRNLSYSLRAFARDLDISPGMLSRILSGKSTPSSFTAKSIAARIGYDEEKQKWFCALVEADKGRSVETRNQAKEFLRSYVKGLRTKKITLESSIDWNWYHFAIRRMTDLMQFRFDYKWIAEQLKLPKAKVTKAIQDLLSIGALIIEDGQLKIKNNYLVLFNGVKPKVREKMEKDIFARMLPSLIQARHEESYHRNHFFVLDKSQVEQIMQLIDSFENQIDDLTYKSKKPDDLFCLSIHFFSMLKSNKK